MCQEIQPAQGCGRARHLRRQFGRHLCLHRRLGEARHVQQGSQPHRQLHQHSRRRHAIPGMIRKAKNKDIRVFLQDGSNDLKNEHGNWWLRPTCKWNPRSSTRSTTSRPSGATAATAANRAAQSCRKPCVPAAGAIRRLSSNNSASFAACGVASSFATPQAASNPWFALRASKSPPRLWKQVHDVTRSRPWPDAIFSKELVPSAEPPSQEQARPKYHQTFQQLFSHLKTSDRPTLPRRFQSAYAISTNPGRVMAVS